VAQLTSRLRSTSTISCNSIRRRASSAPSTLSMSNSDSVEAVSAGRVGEPRLVAYSMAKAGVVGFSKALAKESGRFCVTVNCVSPATTETDATAAWIRAQGEQIMRQYPLAKGLNRLGKPSDIANAVAFLASERAEWITGQVLSVNGGYSMAD